MAKGQLRVRIVGDDSDLRKKLKGSGALVGKFALGVGAAVAAGVAFSVKKFADFDQAMTNSVAIMGDVSTAMRQDMSDAAREVAKTTQFSATEAAESYFFLASAGLDAAASIEALPRVAAFAQAGNFDMARATDLLTDAQSALGLASEDAQESLMNMERVGDVLVKANTLANASVEQFSEALTDKAGAALRNLNKDVEEGVAVLAVYADAGVKGGAAGTQLNAVLEGLTRTARLNEAEYERLGVAVFDSSGEMRNMGDIVGDLEGSLEGMTTEQQLAELASLGLTRTARDGVVQLLGNADAIREYEAELRDAGGTMDEVAGKQMETFWAQLGLLKDQLLDVALSVGEQLMPHLMGFVEMLQRNGPQIEAFVAGALDLMGSVITDVVVPALTTLSAWWKRNGPAIIGTAKALWKGIQVAFDAIVAVVQKVMGWFDTGGKGITESTSEWSTFVAKTWKQVRELIDAAAKFIFAVVDRMTKIVKGIWERWGGDIMRFAEIAWGAIQQIIGGVLDVIIGIFNTFAAVFRGDWSDAWDGVKQIFSGVWQIITGILDAALAQLELLLKIAMDTVKELWGKAWDKVKEVARDAWDSLVERVSGGIDDLLTWFSELPGRIVSALGDLGATLLKAGKDLIDGLIKGALEAIKSIGSKIGEALGGAFKRAFSFIPGIGDGPGIGGRDGGAPFQRMHGMLRQAFPGGQSRLISGYRPGARTSTGNLSYHARKRAIDTPPSQAVAAWVNRHFFAQTKELITPWQNLNIHNGRRHSYSAGVMALHTGRMAHNHWAMAHGGIVRGGRGGISAVIGEGSQSELVAPLPAGFDVRDLAAVGGAGEVSALRRDLQQILQAIEGQGAHDVSIVVEDRSGDPVETARRTALALRG